MVDKLTPPFGWQKYRLSKNIHGQANGGTNKLGKGTISCGHALSSYFKKN